MSSSAASHATDSVDRADSGAAVIDVAAQALAERPPGPAQPPVMRVTLYEQLVTFLVASFVGIAAIVCVLTFSYVSTLPKRPAAVATLELMEELPGGSLDGSPDETLRVDSPYEERSDASIVDNPGDGESTVESTFEGVMEYSETATAQAPQQFLFDAESKGRKGSATGTGRRGLGFGPGKRGFPRDQRWFISFSDRTPLAEYARQLDFFGIELGAVFADRMVFLSQLSGETKMRTVDTGKGENRLYMNWQGGSRRVADLELFSKAGIAAENALVLHFYPAATEAMLAKLERESSERPSDQIKRTYFLVKQVPEGYAFEVTRIVYSQ